ncbi:2OG-Fe(II) oxygenase [Acetobacter oeni]|uniref:Fe2OG dioxygenase domain-containing protein n=1 Tax=Acetobacter oeni TaxID=304077 RepID=A0A511XQ28_9PROT|nr:2OG-Fe(II) oxygenase [Acetobacter oeni]MBB3883727.1 hypothetical protein [Acetobacter oeni]NHO19692.1 2OG-Fe(II) oxygenase [Acetobacter oeni]GEN64996.1 hypothetical protein AOE01nite_32200 [Acetobacter oeni]
MKPVQTGDPAPLFVQNCNSEHGRYSFDMAGGRANLLVFLPPENAAVAESLLRRFRDLASCGNNAACRIFSVVSGPGSLSSEIATLSDIVLTDDDLKVRTLYGFGVSDTAFVLVDPALRIRDVAGPDTPDAARRLARALSDVMRNDDRPVPALMLDRILEPEVCQTLIRYFHAVPPVSSPVLTQSADGKPLAMADRSFKRRFDRTLKDRALISALQGRIIRRVVPEISKVFQCTVTGMDRMLVACYDSSDQGCFGAHRDNTVNGARHRLFAISINLNDDFEGGDLWFPEFSPRGFRPPAGGAVIFSCGLLHAVRPVTRGRRYACLPFVFNEASKAFAAGQMSG